MYDYGKLAGRIYIDAKISINPNFSTSQKSSPFKEPSSPGLSSAAAAASGVSSNFLTIPSGSN